MMKRLRSRWKWRKAKRTHYPLKYRGPTHTVHGVEIENGTPLRRFSLGRKGAQGAAQYIAPDDIIRILPTSQIEDR